MSNQLFSITSFDNDGVIFVNPTNVVSIGKESGGKTFICVGPEEDAYHTWDSMEDVVNRYQAAIRSPIGYAGILIQMNECTGGKTL